jgi:hypothetical protein
MTPEQSDAAELERLQTLLRARSGQPGWEANCRDINQRIAALKEKTK